MATGTFVIQRAFSKAFHQTGETVIEDTEQVDAFDMLKDMLNGWQDSGLKLGYVETDAVADELRVPKSALGAIKANLAVRICGEFGKPVTNELASEADNTYKTMLSALPKNFTSNYPSNLPLGSGSYDNYENEHFYPAQDKVNF